MTDPTMEPATATAAPPRCPKRSNRYSKPLSRPSRRPTQHCGPATSPPTPTRLLKPKDSSNGPCSSSVTPARARGCWKRFSAAEDFEPSRLGSSCRIPDRWSGILYSCRLPAALILGSHRACRFVTASPSRRQIWASPKLLLGEGRSRRESTRTWGLETWNLRLET